MGMLTAIHVPVVKDYLADLEAAVEEVRGGRKAASRAVSYGG